MLVLALVAASTVARGDTSEAVGVVAEVKCEPLAARGKVLCTVRERPVLGKLQWGDVVVVAAPAFAPPLRTRASAGDATRSDADGADFSLALAATGEGTGTLEVLARAVVCGKGGCRPVTTRASGSVVVGPSP